MAEFLDNLPINHEGGLTTEEIQARVNAERQSWDAIRISEFIVSVMEFFAAIRTGFIIDKTASERNCRMTRLLLEDISENFSEVIANLQPGEVVQVVSAGEVVARLIGEHAPLRTEHSRAVRQPGSAIGTLEIISDDDEHLQDFAAYMP